MNIRTNPFVSPNWLLALGLGFALACTGHIGESTGASGDNRASSGSGGSGGGSSSSSGGSDLCTGAAQAGPVHARLLSPSQYDNTVQDLLNIGGNPAEANGVAGGESAALDQTALGFRANAAASIAAQAAASLSTWSPCVPATVAAQATCEQQIIDQIGQRAYRQPLSADESAQMKTLFDAGIAAKDFQTGVDWFLTGVLQTPAFQYQLVRPSATETAGQLVPISGYEMASRLSYFVWDSMPDDGLFAAAASAGGLGDDPSIRAQLDRMLQDQARLVRGMSAFYSNWLNIAGYSEGVVKNDPLFTQDVAVSLGQSILTGATQLYATASPNVSSLFTGETYYMNKTLQDYYQVGGAGTAAFTPTPMPGQHRSGLLTHPGFLAVNARPAVTAPINRGFFVLTNIMCLPLQMPVGLQFPPLPEGPTQGLTTREVIANTHVKPQCASCHDMIDPPGFALEGFDQLGKVRTMDNGKPVDTSGTIVNSGGGTALMSTDLDGPFATGDEFLQRLAQSRTVKACFAKQFLEHAVSGQVSTAVAPEDEGSVECVSQKFAQSGDLVGLVGLVTSSNTFLLRKAE